MNKKGIIFIIPFIFVLLSSVSLAYFMVIDVIQNRVPACYFDHTKHLDKLNGLGFPCEKCHHELKTPEQKPAACSSCHLPKEDSQLVEKNLPSRLKVAYHNMCRGCHTENKRKYKGAPTSECGGCHIKEIDKLIEENAKKRKGGDKK